MRDTIGGQSAAIKFRYVLIQPGRAIQKSIATLLLLVGSSSGLWFGLATNVPHAQAQTLSYDINIDRLPNETYESLVKRAETAARAAVANNLSRSGKAADVSITVVAHNRGAIAPVLNLKVSFPQQSNSNSGREITYFDQARSLLRLEENVATTTPDGSSNNSNRSSGTQPRSTRSSSQTQNANPGSIRRGFGGNSTLSQPGRVVTPTTSGQPTNTFPPSQTNTTNTNPSTSPTGTGFTSTSPSPTQTNSTQPSSTLPSNTGLTPTTPSSTPLNSTQQNSTSPSPGLTPQPVVNPSTVPSGQPILTPSSPTSTNSNNGTSTGGNTSPSNSTTTTPGISPSSSSNGTSTGGNSSYSNSTTTTTPAISPSTR